ncbi:glycosyltransferase family 4 protein [Streptodolium elevatio]
MRSVVVDIRANQRTGVARYGLSLLRALAERAGSVSDMGFRAIADAHQEQDVRRALAGTAVEVAFAPEPDGFVRRSPWLRELLAADAVDLYFTTHYTVDRQCPVPFVATTHDLSRLRFPEHAYSEESFTRYFGADEWACLQGELAALAAWDHDRDDPRANVFQRYFRALNRHQVAHARGFVTVSEATRGDMLRLLGVPAGRVDVVPCGVDTDLFRPRRVVAPAVPYCLFVGLAGPTKRFSWLLETWLRGAGRRGEGELVVVGGYAEQRPEVQELLAAHADVARTVRFTGRVTDDELAVLYSGAAALVVASVNEGNHLGPLEALACGCEVICTDIPPLRETVDGHAHFYGVDDRPALDGLIRRAMSGGLARKAAGFRVPVWSESAGLLVDALRRALATARTADGVDTDRGRGEESQRVRWGEGGSDQAGADSVAAGGE